LFHHHQYVEVDQTIVNRGNQSVGHAVDDQAEMLDTTRRVDDDEVVLVRTPNFPELRYELPQVGSMAKRALLPMKSCLCARPMFLSRDMNRLRVVTSTSSLSGCSCF
jgi:hypothetical protein